MESRKFITEAKTLIDEIKVFAIVSLSHEDEQERGAVLQRQLNQLLGGLQNPTLPSAYKLRNVALDAGFFIDPKQLQWINSFEYIRW